MKAVGTEGNLYLHINIGGTFVFFIFLFQCSSNELHPKSCFFETVGVNSYANTDQADVFILHNNGTVVFLWKVPFSSSFATFFGISGKTLTLHS